MGIYQRTFGADAETACQNDHRDDVRAVFAWAFDGASSSPVASTPWPATCVALNDVVEAHLGNDGNVGIYQRAFGAGSAAEAACQGDHAPTCARSSPGHSEARRPETGFP